MKIHRSSLTMIAASACTIAVAIACSRAVTTPNAEAADPTSQSTVAADMHTPDEEADLIRTERLKEMSDARTGLGATAGCKYESAISTAPPAGKVTITLDDGPEPGQTPWILDTLRRYHIKATFFLIGSKAAAHPDLVKMIEAEGHIIGNHSWTHPNFHSISQAQATSEVTKTDAVLSPYLKPLKLFRYPYGNSTCGTNALVHSMGYHIVGWHEDSCDWAFNRTGSVSGTDARICEVAPQNMSNFVGHVISSINHRHGGILLMHEIQPHTIRQLDTILNQLTAQGYSFINMDSPELAPDLR